MSIDREVMREVEAKLLRASDIFKRNKHHQPEKLADAEMFVDDALANLRKAIKDAQDIADAQKAFDELICECGITGPCMSPECKSPILSCKAMEAKDG